MYPVAFHIGSLVVYWHGVTLVLAYVAGELLVPWLARREKMKLGRVFLWVVFLLLGGVVGARLAGLPVGADHTTPDASTFGGGVRRGTIKL
ncbi:MAG TPA: prolipoprotein diacylglyceryl transferase family protein [Anaerolineae bacterium]|nr:prolipoprotein diacylglyceryl transferase family protein [Anaerolineae bacterium]